MIRIALFAALGSLVSLTAAECGNEEPPKTAPPPFEWASLDAATTATAAPTVAAPTVDPTDARVAGLKRLDAALAATDSKAYAELFASDAVAGIAGISEWRGRDDIAAMHGKIFHAFDDVKVGSSRVFLRRERAAVEWTLTGTHARTWLGVPATSKPIAIHALTIYSFDADGRVKTARIYLDVVSAMSQVGAALPGIEAGPVPKLPSTTEVIVARGTPDEDANNAANDATAKLLEQGNVEGASALYADDTESVRIGGPPAKGRDAVRKGMEAMTKAITDRNVKLDGWAAMGFVIEEVTLTGVNTGSLRGAAPTKKPIVLHAANILEMKDKKVVRSWAFSNRAELFSQIGVKYSR